MERSNNEQHILSYIPSRCTKRLLNISDTLLSLIVISPLVVTYWYGTWIFMDRHPNYFPPIPTLLFGSVWHLMVVLSRQHVYDKVKSPEKEVKTVFGRICKYIFTKLFIYSFSINGIMAFRAIFSLCAPYDGSVTRSLCLLLLSGIPLIIFKSVRNIVASPMVIITDSKEISFTFPTRFKSHTATTEPAFYFLDCAFSVLVIGTLVVFVWRSSWTMCDLLIYPDEQSSSAFGSLALGYGIVAVTFALQPLMKWACDRLTGAGRMCVADGFLFVSFLGTVNLWRGFWTILDLYFLPDDELMSNLICHGVSFVLLAMLNCSNSVLVRGVYIDAEEPGGQCVVFPIYYIRLFFQRERVKKQRRMHDTLEKGEQLETFLEKSDKNLMTNIKSSNSIEMISMANNRTLNDHTQTTVINSANCENQLSQ